MSELEVYLLGEPYLKYQSSQLNFNRRKALALIAYLALAEYRQSRDVVATLLWPDQDQQHAHAALRSTIHHITRVAPGEWFYKDRAFVGIQKQAASIDALSFLSLLTQSRTHQHDSRTLCEECAAWLKQALELYHADFMTGFSIPDSAEYESWQILQREWLRRERSSALRRLAAYYGELGEFEKALAYASHWLEMDTLHEPAHQMLMRLYAANGQRAEALRQYQQCVALLDTELATLPAAETDQLYAAIQNENTFLFHSQALAAERKVSVLPPLPFLIVGRQQALADIKQRIRTSGEHSRPMTIIQGWPGVGKSTIVAALAHDPEIAQLFPDGVLWASLGEAPSLIGELAIWAEAVGVHDAKREVSVEGLSNQLKTLLQDRRILLIVDDVWEAEHLTPFKVGGPSCGFIVTTRLNEVAQALAPTAFDIYRLPVLTQSFALELLQRLAPESVADYPDESLQLVNDLEGLPLAIQVAGRLLNNEARLGWGVGELLQELRTGVALLQAQAPSDMLKIGQATSPTIATLLKRSTDSLDAQNRDRFASLGLFVPKPATFDLAAIAVVWGDEDPRRAVRILVNRGLLEPLSGGRFQMHALLVLHAHSLLEDDEATA